MYNRIVLFDGENSLIFRFNPSESRYIPFQVKFEPRVTFEGQVIAEQVYSYELSSITYTGIFLDESSYQEVKDFFEINANKIIKLINHRGEGFEGVLTDVEYNETPGGEGVNIRYSFSFNITRKSDSTFIKKLGLDFGAPLEGIYSYSGVIISSQWFELEPNGMIMFKFPAYSIGAVEFYPFNSNVSIEGIRDEEGYHEIISGTSATFAARVDSIILHAQTSGAIFTGVKFLLDFKDKEVLIYEEAPIINDEFIEKLPGYFPVGWTISGALNVSSWGEPLKLRGLENQTITQEIYPKPGFYKLLIDSPLGGVYKVKQYSSTGNVIGESSGSYASGANSYSVSISDFCSKAEISISPQTQLSYYQFYGEGDGYIGWGVNSNQVLGQCFYSPLEGFYNFEVYIKRDSGVTKSLSACIVPLDSFTPNLGTSGTLDAPTGVEPFHLASARANAYVGSAVRSGGVGRFTQNGFTVRKNDPGAYWNQYVSGSDLVFYLKQNTPSSGYGTIYSLNSVGATTAVSQIQYTNLKTAKFSIHQRSGNYYLFTINKRHLELKSYTSAFNLIETLSFDLSYNATDPCLLEVVPKEDYYVGGYLENLSGNLHIFEFRGYSRQNDFLALTGDIEYFSIQPVAKLPYVVITYKRPGSTNNYIGYLNLKTKEFTPWQNPISGGSFCQFKAEDFLLGSGYLLYLNTSNQIVYQPIGSYSVSVSNWTVTQSSEIPTSYTWKAITSGNLSSKKVFVAVLKSDTNYLTEGTYSVYGYNGDADMFELGSLVVGPSLNFMNQRYWREDFCFRISCYKAEVNQVNMYKFLPSRSNFSPASFGKLYLRNPRQLIYLKPAREGKALIYIGNNLPAVLDFRETKVDRLKRLPAGTYLVNYFSLGKERTKIQVEPIEYQVFYLGTSTLGTRTLTFRVKKGDGTVFSSTSGSVLSNYILNNLGRVTVPTTSGYFEVQTDGEVYKDFFVLVPTNYLLEHIPFPNWIAEGRRFTIGYFNLPKPLEAGMIYYVHIPEWGIWEYDRNIWRIYEKELLK